MRQIMPVADILKSHNLTKFLPYSLRGVERETLRCRSTDSSHCEISYAPHAQSLGSPLTNKYFKLDFSESLEELVSPPLSSNECVMEFMTILHSILSKHHPEDLLWPFSSPPAISSNPPLANFGTSHPARFRHLYRESLECRYRSTKCQLLAGIHFNFSLSEDLFKSLGGNPTETRNKVYMNCYKNVQLYAWIIMLLTGSSPYLHPSYFNDYETSATSSPSSATSASRDVTFPNATSLRCSYLGYRNPKHEVFDRPINSVSDYIDMITTATTIAYEPFGQCAKYLTNKLIQIPAEFYGIIRPKTLFNLGKCEPEIEVNSWKTPILLEQSGIQYLELRCIDCQFDSSTGLSLELLDLLEVFMIFGCFSPVSDLDSDMMRVLETFFDDICLRGGELLDKNLEIPNFLQELTNTSRVKECVEFLLTTELLPIAQVLDFAYQCQHYENSIKYYINSFRNNNLKFQKFREIVETQYNGDFTLFGCQLARQFKSELDVVKIKEDYQTHFDMEIERSVKEFQYLEQRDPKCFSFEQYVKKIVEE
ncbi:hypothetical protein P9112_008574 [Eukaryota sp. TZLM1-RC]